MTKTSIDKAKVQTGIGSVLFLPAALVICSILMLAGCVSIAPRQQRLVSKPNMQFSGSSVFSYNDKLLTQIESGSASFTGGQSGSCGSCVVGGTQ